MGDGNYPNGKDHGVRTIDTERSITRPLIVCGTDREECMMFVQQVRPHEYMMAARQPEEVNEDADPAEEAGGGRQLARRNRMMPEIVICTCYEDAKSQVEEVQSMDGSCFAAAMAWRSFRPWLFVLPQMETQLLVRVDGFRDQDCKPDLTTASTCTERDQD